MVLLYCVVSKNYLFLYLQEQQKQAKERLEKLALKFKKITLPPVPEHLK